MHSGDMGPGFRLWHFILLFAGFWLDVTRAQRLPVLPEEPVEQVPSRRIASGP
jgi:hypothetical protein